MIIYFLIKWSMAFLQKYLAAHFEKSLWEGGGGGGGLMPGRIQMGLKGFSEFCLTQNVIFMGNFG